MHSYKENHGCKLITQLCLRPDTKVTNNFEAVRGPEVTWSTGPQIFLWERFNTPLHEEARIKSWKVYRFVCTSLSLYSIGTEVRSPSSGHNFTDAFRLHRSALPLMKQSHRPPALFLPPHSPFAWAGMNLCTKVVQRSDKVKTNSYRHLVLNLPGALLQFMAQHLCLRKEMALGKNPTTGTGKHPFSWQEPWLILGLRELWNCGIKEGLTSLWVLKQVGYWPHSLLSQVRCFLIKLCCVNPYSCGSVT